MHNDDEDIFVLGSVYIFLERIFNRGKKQTITVQKK